MTERCPCGRPLHYPNPETQARVQGLIDELGREIPIPTPVGTWLVPQHYIALHGRPAATVLPGLAAKYGWSRMMR